MPLIIELMVKNFFVLFILSFILSFVTMAADNSVINDDNTLELTGNSRTAVVIAPKAIVYSDENMLTPLGYIANGKTILVGNPRRINRNLVPLIVYGRLAFVEVKDLRYENKADEEFSAKRGAPREHDFDITIIKTDERLSENNSAYFSLHQYDAGSDVKETFSIIDNADKSNFTGFALQLIHRQTNSRFFWGAGVDYSLIQTLNMKFEYVFLSPIVGYTILSNPLFSLEAYGGLDLAVNVNYEVETNSEIEPTGYLWGVQGNARLIFFPTTKYQPFGGIGYRKYSVSDLSPLTDNSGVQFDGIRDITSINLFIGLGIKFD